MATTVEPLAGAWISLPDRASEGRSPFFRIGPIWGSALIDKDFSQPQMMADSGTRHDTVLYRYGIRAVTGG